MYFPYEWLAYSCRCILNCDRVVEKETCTTQAVLTFISYILLFLNITSDSRLCFRCFLYCIKRVTLLTMPPMQNTHTHYMSPLLTVPPTHTPTQTHTHPCRAHAKPAVSSVISSRRGTVTLNSWSMERERKGGKVWGRGRKGVSELLKGSKGVLLLKECSY